MAFAAACYAVSLGVVEHLEFPCIATCGKHRRFSEERKAGEERLDRITDCPLKPETTVYKPTIISSRFACAESCFGTHVRVQERKWRESRDGMLALLVPLL